MQCWRNAIGAVAAVTLAGGFLSITRAADLPQSVREATSVDAYKDQINKYVSDQIARVKAGDKSSGAAREELARQPETTQTVSPSSAFQSVYVSDVLADLGPMMSANDVPLRLNAAIIVCRMCDATKAPQLSQTAQKLMKDPSPAVALWGIKSASVLLPTILSVQFNLQNQQLTPSIVACVKDHGDVGAIIQEAYGAVGLPDQQPPLPTAGVQACIDAMNALLADRVGAWQAALPAAPSADRTPPIYLARNTIIQAMTPPEKLDAVQQMLDMLGVASQRASAMPASELRGQIYLVASAYAQALKVLMLTDNEANAAAAFDPLSRLPGAMQPAQITQAVSAALGAVRSLPAYTTLKDIPQVQARAG